MLCTWNDYIKSRLNVYDEQAERDLKSLEASVKSLKAEVAKCNAKLFYARLYLIPCALLSIASTVLYLYLASAPCVEYTIQYY